MVVGRIISRVTVSTMASTGYRAMIALWSSRRPNEAGRRPLASHFRLLELGGGNRAVKGGTQRLGCLQRQLNPSPRPHFEVRVDEVERDDVAQRRVTRVVVGNHGQRERKPFVPALCHALGRRDLDDGGTHVSEPPSSPNACRRR